VGCAEREEPEDEGIGEFDEKRAKGFTLCRTEAAAMEGDGKGEEG